MTANYPPLNYMSGYNSSTFTNMMQTPLESYTDKAGNVYPFADKNPHPHSMYASELVSDFYMFREAFGGMEWYCRSTDIEQWAEEGAGLVWIFKYYLHSIMWLVSVIFYQARDCALLYKISDASPMTCTIQTVKGWVNVFIYCCPLVFGQVVGKSA